MGQKKKKVKSELWRSRDDSELHASDSISLLAAISRAAGK